MMQRGHARTAKSYIEQNYIRLPDGKLQKNISIVPYNIILDPVKGELTHTIEPGKEEPGTLGKAMFLAMFREEMEKLTKLGVLK